MSDQEIRVVERWIREYLVQNPQASAPDLIRAAQDGSQPFSSADLVWAIWYLVAEGRLAVTRDHLVSAA